MNTMVRVVPQAWMARVRDAFGGHAPGWDVEWTRWMMLAMRLLNYDYPILNPIDSRVQYRPFGRPFNGSYILALINIARQQMKKAQSDGTSISETYAHVDDFLNSMLKSKRDFQKLRYWGLIEERSMTKEDIEAEYKLRSGHWRLTRFGWLMLAGHIKIASTAHILLNKVIGFSGPMLSRDDALLLHMKFRWSDTIKPPKGMAHDVTCARCGVEHLSKFVQITITGENKRLCFDCVQPEIDSHRVALMGADLLTHVANIPRDSTDPWNAAFGSWRAPDPRNADDDDKIEVRIRGEAVVMEEPKEKEDRGGEQLDFGLNGEED